MDINNLRMEIDMLLARLSEPAEDEEQLEVFLREKLNQLRAFGQPLPADLVELEKQLDERLTEEEAPKET